MSTCLHHYEYVYQFVNRTLYDTSSSSSSSIIMIHQAAHRLRHLCSYILLYASYALARGPRTVFADMRTTRTVWCALLDIVLPPVCSNQNHLDGGARRGQELPHQAVLRREGEQTCENRFRLSTSIGGGSSPLGLVLVKS